MKKYKITIAGAEAYINIEQDDGIMLTTGSIAVMFEDVEHFNHLSMLNGKLFNVMVTKKYGQSYRTYAHAETALVWGIEPDMKAITFIKM